MLYRRSIGEQVAKGLADLIAYIMIVTEIKNA